MISHSTDPRFPLSAPNHWWPNTCLVLGFRQDQGGNVKRAALGELSCFQVLEWKLRIQRQAFHHAQGSPIQTKSGKQPSSHLEICDDIPTKWMKPLHQLLLLSKEQKSEWNQSVRALASTHNKPDKGVLCISARSCKTGKRSKRSSQVKDRHTALTLANDNDKHAWHDSRRVV